MRRGGDGEREDVLVVRNIPQEGGEVMVMRGRCSVFIMTEGGKYTEV